MRKHTILFLAASPTGADRLALDRLALDREARAIQNELRIAGDCDEFELVIRWVVEPLDLLRGLRELKPTVVHLAGYSVQEVDDCQPGRTPRQGFISGPKVRGEQPHGLFFQRPDGRAQLVSTQALGDTFGAVGSVKLVVLNACYSEACAEALLTHVDCIVWMNGFILDDAARSFAIGFYGGLAARASVEAACRQGRAAIGLEGFRGAEYLQLKVRSGVDAANSFYLANS